MKKYADEYWQGNIIGNPYNRNPLPEIIVQGRITIISSDPEASSDELMRLELPWQKQEREARDQEGKEIEERLKKYLVNKYGDKGAAEQLRRIADRKDISIRQNRESDRFARERRISLGIEKPPAG